MLIVAYKKKLSVECIKALYLYLYYIYIALACNSYNSYKLHAILLQSVISVKLNIGKKTTGLEIMTLNHEEIYVSKLIELMLKGDLHCLQGCFRKQTGQEDI